MVTNSQRGMSRKVTSLERENERLRDLLSIARKGLGDAREAFDALGVHIGSGRMDKFLRRSDPDASTEDVMP